MLDEYCLGIHVSCRRDYEAHNAWPRLGFIATGERPGRGKDGSILNEWWLDLQRPSLFSGINLERQESTLSVAIDAQVFFDLEVEERPNSEDSRALQSDWISNEITLYITGEMLNEVNRLKERDKRNRTRKKVKKFSLVNSHPESFQSVSSKLEKLLRTPSSERDHSDLRHVAHAIAGEMDVFATRDGEIRSWHNQVYETFGLQILHPTEVLILIDYLKDEARYRPARLSGTSLKSCQLRPGQIQEIAVALHDSGSGERLRALQNNISSYSSPRNSISNTVVRDEKSGIQGIMTLTDSGNHQATVSLLRVKRTRLGKTLSRHLIEQAISTAMHAGKNILTIDPSNDTTGLTLGQAGFFRNSQGWTKISMPALNSQDVLSELRSLQQTNLDASELANQILTTLRESLRSRKVSALADIEKMLWPNLILDAPIPTFIVPIKPNWAKDLFDTTLAEQDLFGADSELSLRPENVYYRAARPNIFKIPGRIIWYVSSGSRTQLETKCLKAWSHIEEVTIGAPKRLFDRHRRLGVYEWRHIKELAKRNENKPIMAIRFGRTQAFDQSVNWNKLQSILEKHTGKRNQLQSPVRIGAECLTDILSVAFPPKG